MENTIFWCLKYKKLVFEDHLKGKIVTDLLPRPSPMFCEGGGVNWDPPVWVGEMMGPSWGELP